KHCRHSDQRNIITVFGNTEKQKNSGSQKYNTDQDKKNLFSLKHTEGHSSVFQILKLQNSGNKSNSFCVFEIKRGKIFCKLIRRCKKDDSCDKQKTPHTGRSSFHGLLIIFHLSILRIPSDSSVSVTVLSTKL